MGARITSDQIWTELESQLFGVVGIVTEKGEARTAGIVYVVRDRNIYFYTDTDAWKTKHLQRNPSVSMTVPIAKRVPFIPWLRIPPATITFSGTGRVLPLSEVPAEVPDKLLKDLQPKEQLRRRTSVVEITLEGDFITYGVGVPIRTMLLPMEAGGRAPVA